MNYYIVLNVFISFKSFYKYSEILIYNHIMGQFIYFTF